MKKYFFNFLSLNKKSEYVMKNGLLIGSQKKNGRTVFLYFLNNFFAEIWHENDAKNGSIEKVKTFYDIELIRGYLHSPGKKIA